MDEKKLKALAAEVAEGLKPKPISMLFPHVDEAYRRNSAQCGAG